MLNLPYTNVQFWASSTKGTYKQTICNNQYCQGIVWLYLDMAVVTCLAVIPPELGKDNFGLPAKILYVPAGSVEVYRKNAVWREAFETIAALP